MNDALAAITGFLGGIPAGLQDFLAFFLSGAGLALLISAVLLVCVIGTGFFYFRQLRELAQHLHALSEIMQEQSRAIDSMRRTLEDALDVLASLQVPHPVRGQPAAPADGGIPLRSESVALLREELESLRAEILAEASGDAQPLER